MFRTKLTLAGLVVAAAFLGLGSGRALAAHDSWHGYAISLSRAQQAAPFITDTLARGGAPSVGGRDPWYGYAVSLTRSQPSPQSVPFITDTLAPGGTTRVEGARFTTDTLAPGGGSPAVSAPASASPRFDWGDAGIGAVVMGGIALVLVAGRRAVQRRRVVAA